MRFAYIALDQAQRLGIDAEGLEIGAHFLDRHKAPSAEVNCLYYGERRHRRLFRLYLHVVFGRAGHSAEGVEQIDTAHSPRRAQSQGSKNGIATTPDAAFHESALVPFRNVMLARHYGGN